MSYKDKQQERDPGIEESQIEAQVDALTQGCAPPTLADALLSLEMSAEGTDVEEFMKQTPRDDEAPSLPGLHLLTGLVTGHATAEEQQLWDEVYAQEPEAKRRLGLLDGWSHDADIEQELAAVMARGDLVRSSLPPISSDFWEQLDEPGEPAAMEATASVEPALYVEEAAPEMGISLEAPATAAPTSTPPAPGWGDWMRWSAPAVLTLAWFLIFPKAPSQDGAYAPSKTRSIPLFRPAPAVAQPKGKLPPKTTGISIELYCRRQKQLKRIPLSFAAKAGDELRFFVRQPTRQKLYLLLFLSDERGEVNHLYPAREDGLFRMPFAPKGKYLPDGATVTTLRGHERIYACVSQEPIPYMKAIPLLHRARKFRSLAKIKALPLPCLYQKSWLLTPTQEGKQTKR